MAVLGVEAPRFHFHKLQLISVNSEISVSMRGAFCLCLLGGLVQVALV